MKGSFPVTLAEYLRVSVLSLSVISGVERAITSILNGKVVPAPVGQGGSNAFAFHRDRTTDSTTDLAINSHQPLEGPVAWYEAHLCSEQGWNILGGLFPGGTTVFHGANEHLGWAHTVNYQDKIDTYQLQTDKAHPGQYLFDNQWLPLEVKTVKLRVKGIPFAIGRKAYYSKYGPTMVTKTGIFAVRFGANQDLRGLEQWYRMNKARSFAEFRQAIAEPAIPGFNIIYADADTIYFVTNGKIPYRDPAYNWLGTLPGNTSRTLWTRFRPLADFPQLTNPRAGYVFNMNNTPFNATAPDENLHPDQFDATMGFERWNTNRSTRFGELMAERVGQQIDYADFKRIKYDLQFPRDISYPLGPDISALFALDPARYAGIREEIETLKTWNRQATADSRGAALYGIFHYYMADKTKDTPSPKPPLTPDDCAEGLQLARMYLLKHFGRTNVTLGEYQQHVRGKVETPIWGLPDVLAAINTLPYTNAAGQMGRMHSTQGESYIMLAKFPKTGLPVLETVNCFGASARPDSPHYTDQMGLFTQMKTKPMTLDKAAVLRTAKRTYHPGE